MRIGIDVRELEKGRMTGIGRYLLNFLAYVAENDTDNEYILFGNQRTSFTSRVPRIRLKIIPELLTLFWDQIVLPYQIRKEGIDLFYSPYYKGPIFTSAKLVITIHDILPLLPSPNKTIRSAVLRLWYSVMARGAERIITVSRHSKDTMEASMRVPPGRIDIVHDSVADIFRPLPKQHCLKIIKERFPSLKDFILYVGNLKPHKNLAGLIRAYKLLPCKLRDRHQIFVCGKKDKFYGPLSRLVKTEGLESNVIFADFVEDEVLPYLYNAASVLVFPSLYEGFGLPVVEAMACGTAVIASDIPPMREIAAEAAILADPYNPDELAAAIVRVLTEDALRKEMTQKGLTQAKRFSRSDSANKILEIFKKTL